MGDGDSAVLPMKRRATYRHNEEVEGVLEEDGDDEDDEKEGHDQHVETKVPLRSLLRR